MENPINVKKYTINFNIKFLNLKYLISTKNLTEFFYY